MNIDEAYHTLKNLRKMGHGHLELVSIDCCSGVSSGIDISNEVSEKTNTDDTGILCDWDNGDEYVAVYLD